LSARVKVLRKGRITIPAKIRKMLGIEEGDILTLELQRGCIVLLPPRAVPNPTESLDGLLEGISVGEPVKEELKGAVAARIEGKSRRV